MIDSRACVPVAGLRHLASPRPPGAECGSGERLCCRLGFRLWTASPDSFSRHSPITSTFNRFRTAQKPRDKPWLDGYRRVLSTAAQGKLLTPERRAPKAGCWGVSDGRRAAGDCQCQQRGTGCVFVCHCVRYPPSYQAKLTVITVHSPGCIPRQNTAISSGLP